MSNYPLHIGQVLVWTLEQLLCQILGQADYTVLVYDCLIKLYGLLHLAVEYCEKYHVELVADKTKLISFVPSSKSVVTDVHKISNPLNLDGHKNDFVSSAEHLGIICSIDSNMPNILNRLSSLRHSLLAQFFSLVSLHQFYVQGVPKNMGRFL